MIRGKRAFLARVVHALRVDELVGAASRKYGETTLTVVNYHRVNTLDVVGPFAEGTLDVTPDQFRQQLRLLSRRCTVLDPASFRAHLRDGDWPAAPALVTFDDGYADNLHVACPILQECNIKALFFIATDYVARRRVFWWDRICYVLRKTPLQRFSLTYPRPHTVDLSSRVAAEKGLYAVISTSPDLDLERFLQECGDNAQVSWTHTLERELADQLILTWAQVGELLAAGMAIGSHTRTHRILGTLSADQLDSELLGSRQDIRAELGHDVWAIAYPVGYRVSNEPNIRAALQKAEYEVGFTYNGYVVPLKRLDLFDVPRLAVERDWTVARFGAALSFAAFR